MQRCTGRAVRHALRWHGLLVSARSERAATRHREGGRTCPWSRLVFGQHGEEWARSNHPVVRRCAGVVPVLLQTKKSAANGVLRDAEAAVSVRKDVALGAWLATRAWAFPAACLSEGGLFETVREVGDCYPVKIALFLAAGVKEAFVRHVV